MIVGGIIESLGIDWRVVIAQALSFLVLLVFLIKWCYQPVEAMLRQRQEQIANNLTSAEAQQMQAESLRKEYEGHLANIADDEARTRMDQAMKDAEAARQQLLEKTQEDIRETMQARHQAQLALIASNSGTSCARRCPMSAVMAAAKALRTQLTPQIHSAVIDQVIADLDRASVN